MSNLAKAIWIAAVFFAARGIATATWETHDWTIDINGTTYGLQELYDLPDQRRTLFHYGGSTCRIIHAPIYVVSLTGIALVSIPLALLVIYAHHRFHRSSA